MHRELAVVAAPGAKGLIRMPAGRQIPGPFWVDGSIALRVRDRRHRSWRMVKVRRPFAVLGCDPRADLVIDGPGVAAHHAFLFLDARGLFGVDLRTERGTRFAGLDAESSWLGSGDVVEVGHHQVEVVQLRVAGSVLSGPLADDDPLSLIDPGCGPARDLTLRLLDESGTSWSIGSSLVFLGGGSACAVGLAGEGIGPTHAAILRVGTRAYLAPFPGMIAYLNDRPVVGATEVVDADVVRIGPAALLIGAHELVPRGETAPLDRLADRLGATVGPGAPAGPGSPFEVYRAVPDAAGGPVDYPSLIGRLQAETAALIAVLLRRIEALDDEVAALRERLDDGDRARAAAAPPPVEKLRWDLMPRPVEEGPASGQSGPWLVARLRELEAERQSAWSNLLGRAAPGRMGD